MSLYFKGEDPSSGASLGRESAEGLFKNLSASIQGLAQNKIEKLLQDKQNKSIDESLKGLGFSPEQAKAIAPLSKINPQAFSEIIKQKQQEPGQKSYAQMINQILQGGQPGKIGQQEQMREPSGQQEQMSEPSGQPGVGGGSPMFGGGVNANQATQLAKLIQHKQDMEQKESLATRKMSHQESMAARKTFEPQWQGIKDKARAAEKNIHDYNALIKIIDTDKNLRSGPAYQILKKFGWEELGTSTGTQLAEKVIARMSENASASYNVGRLTNLDLESYQRSLGSLKNTPEGLKAIAKSAILKNEAEVVLKNAVNQVLDKTGNKPTDRTIDEAQAIAAPRLKELADQDMKLIEDAITQQNAGPLSVGKKFNDLPSPKSLPVGSRIRSADGKIIVNTGTKWEKE